MHRMAALIAVVAAPAPAHAQAVTPAEALIAEAERAPDPRAAAAAAERAIRLAEAERPHSTERHYRALQVLSLALNRFDMARVPGILQRMAAVAEAGWGPRAHRTLWARFNAAHFATLLKQPGGGIEVMTPLAEALATGASSPAEQVEAANALSTIADYLSVNESVDRARPFLTRAVAILDGVPPETSADIGDVYFTAARVTSVADQPAEAIALAERSIAAYAAAGEPENDGVPAALGIAAHNASRLGDYDRAEASLRRAVAIADSRSTMPASARLRAAMDYGLFLAATRRYALAFPLIERAVEMAGAASVGAGFRRDLTMAAARVYIGARRPADALRLLGAVSGDDAEPPSRLRALVLMDMARAHLQAGDIAAAEAFVTKARGIVVALAPPDAPLGGVLDVLTGDVALARSDFAAAEGAFASALARQQSFKAQPRTPAETRIKLAISQVRAGRLDAQGWASARLGADVLIADAVRTAASRRAPTVQNDAVGYYDGAIEIAWATAQRR